MNNVYIWSLGESFAWSIFRSRTGFPPRLTKLHHCTRQYIQKILLVVKISFLTLSLVAASCNIPIAFFDSLRMHLKELHLNPKQRIFFYNALFLFSETCGNGVKQARRGAFSISFVVLSLLETQLCFWQMYKQFL